MSVLEKLKNQLLILQAKEKETRKKLRSAIKQQKKISNLKRKNKKHDKR